jgi:4-hydroxy-tetrahydrodipicolinate reductase
MAEPPRVALIGATGRMGCAIAAIADSDKSLALRAAVVSPTSRAIGADLGELALGRRSGVLITGDVAAAIRSVDVVIDFSRPEASSSVIAASRAGRKPLLIGTTGLTTQTLQELEQAARDIPLLVAPNTSLGIAVLLELARTAANALPPAFRVEISEAHHRGKRDAPSGTALALRDVLASARGVGPDTIAVTSVREGDIAGEHVVSLLSADEQVRLEHRVTDRSVFARGAVKAAVWLVGRPAGRYSMRHVLGLETV